MDFDTADREQVRVAGPLIASVEFTGVLWRAESPTEAHLAKARKFGAVKTRRQAQLFEEGLL